jgi:hypothetical protein
MVFQVNTKCLFLTYPTAPVGWHKEYVLEKLYELIPLVSRAVVGRELHADGQQHFHALILVTQTFRSRDERCLDIDGQHPNIQSARSAKKAEAYCRKEGDVAERGDWSSEEKPGWSELLHEATSIESFLSLVKTNYPRDYVLNHEKLLFFAKNQYRTILPDYVSNPSYVFTIPDSLTEWVSQHLRGGAERPKSLWLCGGSRLGKTEWARSLGVHIYWNAQYSLDVWNVDANYLIIDDIDWKYVPAKKSLLGAQKEFTMTDKYRKKQTLTWGKPSIFLCNQDMNVYYTCEETEWLRFNCLFVSINTALY